DLAELAEPASELAGQLGETLRADHQQSDDEDHEELWGSDVQHREVRTGIIPGPSYPWHLGTAGGACAAQAVRMFRSPGSLASDLLGDRAHFGLEAPSRPPQDQHMTAERENEAEQRQGADGAQNDPHDEPRRHLGRCYTGPPGRAKRSVAAVREEVADVRVVLEEVVELDQVIRRQARGRRLTGLRVLLVLLVEELRRERGAHIRAADVH